MLKKWFVIAVSSVVLGGSAVAAPTIKNVVLVLNVWDEKLPEFDHEAIGAKYKGINKEPMDEGEPI